MKKSLLILPLAAALLCACGGGDISSSASGGGSSASGSTSQVGNAVVYDFSSLTGTGTELTAETALTSLSGCVTSGANIISEATVTKVYDGAGAGGAHENQTGLLKFGTGKVSGSLVLTLSKSVSKVTVNIHDYYAKSESYPTGSNQIVVNGTEKQCPYNETGSAENLSFDISASSTITIESKNVTEGKSGRFYVFSLSLE